MPYCHRCARGFRTWRALHQHETDSPSHHICRACGLDFSYAAGLSIHDAQVHNHCDECGRTFDNYNNLHAHKVTHLAPTVPCFDPDCNRRFVNVSAMFIHLEGGACTCELRAADIDDLLEFHWGPWRNQHWDRGDPCPYACDTCGRQFGKVSGLLQHIESPACKCSFESRDCPAFELLSKLDEELGWGRYRLYRVHGWFV